MQNPEKKDLYTPSYRAQMWKPGQSGNPAGRPNRIDRLVKKMLDENSVAAAKALCDIVKDPKVSSRVRCRAAEVILDRVYGKPRLPIDACGKVETVVICLQGDAPGTPQTVAAPALEKPGAVADTRTEKPDAQQRIRPNQFQPGQAAANPAGRRKYDPEVKQTLIEGSLLAAETLCELIHSPRVPPGVRARAAEAILERVYGKAVQPICAAAGEGAPVEIQLAGMLAEWAR